MRGWDRSAKPHSDWHESRISRMIAPQQICAANVRFGSKADIGELISITRLALVTIRNSRVGTERTIGSAPRDHSTYGVFSHVPSPGVPGGPQRPKIGQTQILSRRELSLLSCPTLELIEFGSRNAATKNNAPETSSKKYLAQPSINLTLALDRLISDAAIDQTIIGSTAPKTNISREYLTAWVICIATSGT